MVSGAVGVSNASARGHVHKWERVDEREEREERKKAKAADYLGGGDFGGAGRGRVRRDGGAAAEPRD